MTYRLDDAALVLAYGGGIPVSALARQYGVDHSVIKRRLVRAGVTLRTASEQFAASIANDPTIRDRMGAPRKYGVDESFFDSLTDRSLYALGLLLSDGYVTPRHWSISLQARDAPLLRAVADAMDAEDRPLVHESPALSVAGNERLEVTSRRMASAIIGYGIESPKTHVEYVDGRLAASRDFWRGVIDGDGSLCVGADGRKHLTLVGAESVCAAWLAFSRSHGAALRINVRPHKSIFCVHMTSKDAVRMAGVLYSGAGLALPRKRAVAEVWGV